MDYLFIGLVFLVSSYIIFQISIANNISFSFISLLYLYHVIFTVAYYLIFLTGSADAHYYYRVGTFFATSNLSQEVLKPGAKFIVFIISNIYSIVPLSKFSFFYLFGQFGFFGLLFLYLSIKPLVNTANHRWAMLVCFIPGLNFWSSALGKDSLIFLPICYCLYLFSNNKISILRIGLSILLIFLVRPYIAFILMTAICLASLFANNSLSFGSRSFIFIAAVISGIYIMPVVGQQIGVSEFTIENIIETVNKRAGYNQRGTTSINIKEYGLFLKLFTYMFRPLFFDASGLMGLAASLDNIIYLIAFSLLIRLDLFRFVISSQSFPVYLAIIFSFGALLILASTTANLGIAIRQKTMFFPFILYVVFNFYHWRAQSDGVAEYTDNLSTAAPGYRFRENSAASLIAR